MTRTSRQPAPEENAMTQIQLDSLHLCKGPTTRGMGTLTEISNNAWDNVVQFHPNHLGESRLCPNATSHSGGTRVESFACMEHVHSASSKSKRKGRRQHPSRFSHTISETPTSSPHTSSDNKADTKKPYNCTVCHRSFKDIYGWKRHESSVHGYSDIEWVCMLSGAGLPGTEGFFCSETIQDFHHLDEHDIQSCLNKSICDRTFTRKDLLKQHVQQIHLVTADESISRAFKVPQAWSKEVETALIKREALWCGFCLSACDSIGERMDHVAEHFRNGDDIDNWIPHTIM
jgi:hypothetical protein